MRLTARDKGAGAAPYSWHMTDVHLEGITVLADDVHRLADFFDGVLGLAVVVREAHYVELSSPGVRFAIFSRSGMGPNTGNHPSFFESRRGQSFELNFQCAAVSDVDRIFDDLVTRGAEPVARPTATAWGHHTGFFADPEGNIHSLFAELPA